jgi:hypothetical protein
MSSIQDIIYELMTLPGNYGEAKLQSEKLDLLFGFNFNQIEKDLLLKKDMFQKNDANEERQFWIGLDIQSLQTPYSEIVEMIQKLKPKAGDVWLDLGAGYGRIGLILGLLCSGVNFFGYEFIAERVNEGNRVLDSWQIKNGGLLQADLVQDKIDFEKGDVFFLYDFGSRSDVYKVLEKLQFVASKKSIQVIARGRGVKNWILMDFPWLGQVHEPQHFENWSLFRS